MRKVLILFGQLTDRDVRWLVDHGSVRATSPDDTLIERGRSVDSLFLVLDGYLSVFYGAREVAELEAGDVVGEMSFLDGRPPSATVRGKSHGQVLEVPRLELEEKLQRDTGFASRFYRALGMFLSFRLRQVEAIDGEDSDELDPNILDSLSAAGDRFARLCQQLEAQDP